MEKFSFFDILNEADGDENSSPAPDSQDNMAAEPSENSDFNMDTDIDNNDDSGDDAGTDDDLGDGLDMDSDSSDSSNSSDSSSDSGDNSDDEAVEANTDIFFALSQEEQQIKIKELKGLYASLYQSCDDLIERLEQIDAGDHNINNISRINNQLSNLKLYIADYLSLTFPTKSFVENDIMFNRFLDIINSVSKSIELIINKREKELKED